MTGWIIFGVIILLLVLLCLIPVGLHVKYEAELYLRLLIGPFSVTLLPKKEPSEKKEEQQPAEDKKASDKDEEKRGFKKPNREQIMYSLHTLPGILKKALGRTRRGVTIKPLFVKAVFAGEDPADVAQNYGKAQALVSALYPELKKLVRIKKVSISLSTDYEQEQMRIAAELGIHLRIGTILLIVFSAGFAIVRWFLGYRKLASPETKVEANKEKHDQAAAA